MKAYVISQPKAGTYLCTNVLVELGLNPTGIHCNGVGRYQKYDIFDQSATGKVDEFTHEARSFADVLSLIPEDGFAVGHVEFSWKRLLLLRRFKKIVVTRPFEEFDAANQRFFEDIGRRADASRKRFDRISRWKTRVKVFHLGFHDMIDRRVDRLDALQVFLFGELRHDSADVIERALRAPSRTKTRIRQ